MGREGGLGAVISAGSLNGERGKDGGGHLELPAVSTRGCICTKSGDGDTPHLSFSPLSEMSLQLKFGSVFTRLPALRVRRLTL